MTDPCQDGASDGADTERVHPKGAEKCIGYSFSARCCSLSSRRSRRRHPGSRRPGTRIGLLAPPTTFAADTPFYITQGFTCEASKTACLSGLTHFDLYVDGQQLPSATDLTFATDGTLLSKFTLTNFPSGLSAGPHVFRGEWYYLGELALTQTVTIDFV